MASTGPPSVIFLGKIGVGKTTTFNKICDAARSTEISSYSVTRTYAKQKVFYDGKEMVVFDGPGCKSKRDTYSHSYVMRHGLTHEPLNGIFIFVEFNTRIGSIMAEDFWEVAKMIKPEHQDMLILVVTKMDYFQPEGMLKSQGDIEDHIRGIFAKDFEMDRVVFSDRSISKEDLFDRMYNVVKDMPAVQLRYSEVEFLQYFELKAWKGREMHDLYRTKNLINEIKGGFLEGLQDLQTNRQQYDDVEFQDYVYSALQQSRQELEDKVYKPFRERNGANQIEFDDYTAFIELQKLVHAAHNEVRDNAKQLLNVNPDNTADWRNSIRRCQYLLSLVP